MKKKYFTKKQQEILNLIWPGPTGRGLSIRDACKEIGISECSGYARLKTFKVRFPESWDSFEAARELSRKHRIQLYGGARQGYSIEEKHNDGYDNFILEKF